MRKVALVRVLIPVAVAILLAACQSTAPATPSPAKGAPAAGQATPAQATPVQASQPEGTLNVGLSAWGDGLADPPVAHGRDKNQLILVFDWLVGTTIKGDDISPDTGIANKWEQAPDGSSWTFYLRKGAQFHDGYGEVTADDVKFSVERVMNSPKSKAEYAGALRAAIDKIEVIDPYTVKFALKQPALTLPYDLSLLQGTEGIVVSKKHIDKVGEDAFTSHPIGSGPYKFVELVPGSYLKLTATDKHFALGVPKFKDVYVRFVPNESTRVAMLKTGELDVIDVSPDRVGELEKDYVTTQKAGSTMMVVYYAAQWQGVFTDKRVRQAIDLAINKQELAKTIFGGRASVMPGMMYTTWSVGAKPFKEHPYDPEKAKALLQEAGKSNLQLDMPASPQWRLVVQAIAGQLEKVGIKVNVLPVDDSAIDAMVRGAVTSPNPPQSTLFQMSVANRLFPLPLYNILYTSKGAYSMIRDPKLEAMVSDLAKSKNVDEYGTSVAAIQKYLDDEQITIPLLEGGEIYVGNPKKVQKWSAGAKGAYEMGLPELVWRGK